MGIYIEREREQRGEGPPLLPKRLGMATSTLKEVGLAILPSLNRYVYIYIYIERERERKRKR